MGNIFDNLPLRAPLKRKYAALADEITLYLREDIVDVQNPIKWWCGKRDSYPQLSRMALDYLTIPGNYFIAFAYPNLTCHAASYFH